MRITHKPLCFLALAGSLVLTSCEQSFVNSTTQEAETPQTMETESTALKALSNDRDLSVDNVPTMQEVNEMLAASNSNIRLYYAETVTLGNGGATEAGQTIYANDRQKRLPSQWVPGDTRRGATGNDLTYLIYTPFAPANWGTADQIDGEPAIDASMDTWNEVKRNTKLNIVKVPDTGANPSYILGGNPFLADISEIGFLPPIYFEVFLGAGSSSNVLGVTFTYTFVDADGNPSDINNDGYADVALKEVWYNDGFLWTDTGNSNGAIDIETVALHENGHALGFGHFGKISVTESNNKLHVSPRAVMNAIILGTQRELLGTDKASYTSIFGNWPKD